MSTERAVGLGAELRAVRGLSVRWFREMTVSVVGFVVMLAIKPVVWYLLFGSLFQDFSELPGFPAGEYKLFILPGVAALMALEFVAIGGKCVVDDIQTGFIDKVWAAPISRASVVAARLVVMSTMSVVQTTFLLLLAYVDGITLVTGLPGAALFVLLAALMAASATALSLFVGYAIKYEFAFSMVVTFLVLPILFVSNAFVPTEFMPGWLATVAQYNPISVAVTGMRTLAIDGWVWSKIAPSLGLFVGFTVVLSVVTAWTFTRTLESESKLVELISISE